jgi:hypothetical protein|tara:strand:+ start:67 stop:207 length:141 start_codon:yes stop_codon:yes gene_type:complete
MNKELEKKEILKKIRYWKHLINTSTVYDYERIQYYKKRIEANKKKL